MADIGSGYGSIAELLSRLLHSPRGQALSNTFGRQFVDTANRYGAGPFGQGTSSLNNSNAGPGAYANLGSIINRLGSGVGNLASQPQQAQPQDPMQILYQQLLDQLQSPVAQPKAVDNAAIMRQVQDALNPIYDQRARSAEEKTGRYEKDVKGMYDALAKDYERLAPEQAAQAADAQQQIQDLYGQLRSNITGSYARISQEQGDLFKQLGIEDALPDVLDDQSAAVNDASIAASENQAQQEQRYMDIGQMDQSYYREGSPIATMTGNEQATNLVNKLQDYLAQIDAERTAAIQSGYLDQLGQAQNQFSSQQSTANSETARRQEMLWQMLQGQLNGSNTKLTPDTFMAQLNPNTQQSVAQAFTQLQRSPEAVYGKVQDPRNPVPGTFVETTPQWYMAQADNMYKNGQIDAATYQALQMYMQLYFGS